MPLAVIFEMLALFFALKQIKRAQEESSEKRGRAGLVISLCAFAFSALFTVAVIKSGFGGAVIDEFSNGFYMEFSNGAPAQEKIPAEDIFF